jgi:phenylpyruvate tautomerase PptA (4-oxalocrotonate tautomerase family)
MDETRDGGISRRAILATASAAGALAAAPAIPAEAAAVPDFGAPIVELQFPVGVLSREQKAAMIAGVTDVVVAAMRQPPDPARRLFVQILETPEGGFGVNGKVVVPRAK